MDDLFTVVYATPSLNLDLEAILPFPDPVDVVFDTELQEVIYRWWSDNEYDADKVFQGIKELMKAGKVPPGMVEKYQRFKRTAA